MPDKRLLLLAFDSTCGISAGCLTLLSPYLFLALYEWPPDFTRFVAFTSMGYGLYSGFLAILLRRKGFLLQWMVLVLIVGNGLWSIQCFFQAWRLRGEASSLGVVHLILEGVFVGLLAYFEAKIVLPYAEETEPVR